MLPPGRAGVQAAQGNEHSGRTAANTCTAAAVTTLPFMPSRCTSQLEGCGGVSAVGSLVPQAARNGACAPVRRALHPGSHPPLSWRSGHIRRPQSHAQGRTAEMMRRAGIMAKAGLRAGGALSPAASMPRNAGSWYSGPLSLALGQYLPGDVGFLSGTGRHKPSSVLLVNLPLALCLQARAHQGELIWLRFYANLKKAGHASQLDLQPA